MEQDGKPTKVTDYETYRESPYRVVLHSKVHNPQTEHKNVVGDDGVQYGIYEIPKAVNIVVDPKPYTKMFHGNTAVLIALSESAMRMFYYICDNIQPGKDDICIMMEDYFQFAGYSGNSRLTYYRAVEGLLKAAIISRKAGYNNCFFVNPDVIFNGDRTKLKNIDIRPVDKRAFSGHTKKERVFNMPPE